MFSPFMFGPFSRHLLDAIRHNLRHAPAWSRQSGGRSAALSFVLIGLEILSLPLAAWLDARSHRAPQHRLLLDATFMSMSGVAGAGHSPRLTGGRDAVQLQVAGHLLEALHQAARRSALADLPRVCAQAYAAVCALETRHQAHLAMSRHVIESIARSAEIASAMRLDRDRFARDLVAVQLLALPLCPFADSLAQRCHAVGAGVLVHDLPPIPSQALDTRDAA